MKDYYHIIFKYGKVWKLGNGNRWMKNWYMGIFIRVSINGVYFFWEISILNLMKLSLIMDR